MLTGRDTPTAFARPLVSGLLFFIVCLGVYIPTVATTHVNTDAAANSLAAWRLAHTGTPWMDGLDLREPGKVSHFGVGRDGHMVTTRTPGQIWAAAPFYLGSDSRQSSWTFVRGGVAAAAVTALAASLMYLGLRRMTGSAPIAVVSAAVFAFATPVWSVSANALWTHPVTLVGICGGIWALSRDSWWLAGLWLGIAMTGRVHLALTAAVVGLGVAWARRDPRIAVKLGVPTACFLILIMSWNAYTFGSLDPRGAYVGHEVENILPAVSQGSGGFFMNLAGFLVSPDRGVLVWTPVLVVLAPAVIRAWPLAPDWSRWLAIGGVVYSIAQTGLNVFHGGDVIYGYRLGLEGLACLIPIYVCSLRQAGAAARCALPLIIGLQAGAFFVGSVFTTVSLPETRVWHENALLTAIINFPASLGVVFLGVTIVWSLSLFIVGAKFDLFVDSTPVGASATAHVSNT